MSIRIATRPVVTGSAEGRLLASDVPLSFWGGVDPTSGEVVDRHHPLSGRSIAGRVLALPGSRGSCTGSAVFLELVANGTAPAAVLVVEGEEIVSLGAIVADLLFGRSPPLARIDADDLARLPDGEPARIEGATALVGEVPAEASVASEVDADGPDGDTSRAGGEIALSELDRALLDGTHGEGAALAMRIVLRMAALQGAGELLDVTRVHIDGCIYTGPASLGFARRFVELGSRVRVPTTLNTLSVDRRRWRDQGIDAKYAHYAPGLTGRVVRFGSLAECVDAACDTGG